MQIFVSSDVSAFWFHAYCLLGLGLLVGVLLRLLAQKTCVYTGTLFKLCHRPRSSELVWIVAFNQSTSQLPLTYGIFIFPPHCRFIRSETPSGCQLTITSCDRRSTISDGRDAVKFTFHLPSCSRCPDIPPPEMDGIVWGDGSYTL